MPKLPTHRMVLRSQSRPRPQGNGVAGVDGEGGWEEALSAFEARFLARYDSLAKASDIEDLRTDLGLATQTHRSLERGIGYLKRQAEIREARYVPLFLG